jgi:hypothetical protein
MRVFPCIVRSKKPLIDDNLRRATTDPNPIRGWWKVSECNIGIATGSGSGIWVLDVDGPEGEQTLRKLEAERGALPETVEVITGGEGRHIYFKWPSGIEVRNSQDRYDLPGIDWRGEGGYVLAPPSVHPNGRVYAWSVDSANEFADAPDWLIELVTCRARASSPPTAQPPEVWRAFFERTYEGSHRGHAIARLAGLLLAGAGNVWTGASGGRRYVDPWAVLYLCQDFNVLRCIEPLAADEVRRIVNDIAKREAVRRGVAA